MDLAFELRRVRIVPVMVIEDLSTAIPVAMALVEGGLNVLEVTLRTGAAYEAIGRISKEIPEAIVGAGTVLSRDDVEKSRAAGAKFIVSPGLTENLVTATTAHAMPVLPGVASASDIMRGMDLGLTLFKFFPAENIGGPSAIRALQGPFPNVRFCPTGGITPANLAGYLTLPNVVAVGGSWMVPRELIDQREFGRISVLAREALSLASFAE